MSRLSQPQKIVEVLKSNPNQKFTARQIAKKIVDSFPEDYRDKRQNPRFADEKHSYLKLLQKLARKKIK